MELLTDELAEAAGLRRYEIANLARPGFESRHNLLYWRRRPYLAIGPGAHASDGAQRRTWNAARLDGYLAALADGRLPPGGSDEVDAATAIAESAILGLRLVEGIDSELSQHPLVAPGLAWARQHGMVEDIAGRTRLTQSGRLLANEVFARLLPPVGRAQAGVSGRRVASRRAGCRPRGQRVGCAPCVPPESVAPRPSRWRPCSWPDRPCRWLLPTRSSPA